MSETKEQKSKDPGSIDGRSAAPTVKSYALVEPEIMGPYMRFYKATYERGHLDRKTKELVAIAASLVAGCKGCLEGHLKKAIKFGATRGEISETIAITLGVNAAAIVDRSDIAAANLGITVDDLPAADSPKKEPEESGG